jgi:ketosteroid isomerase-like protein
MKRRAFVAFAAALVVSACAPNARSPDDAAAVQQAIKDDYAAYSGFDKRKYREKLADDYLLLENGELIDREGDIASMAQPGTGHRRTDEFDFRSIKIDGDFAYAVYFLKSDIHDDNMGTRHREWLESAILRRSEGTWRLTLLHSTRISIPAGAQDMKSFATRYTAAWCSQDPASVAAFFAENGSLKINDGAPSIGRAAITEAARGFMSAFPDLVVEMDGLDRKGDGYIYRWTLIGTNTGPGGTGNKVRISGFEEWTIGTDGLIVGSLGHFDAADYKRQLENTKGGMAGKLAEPNS